MSTQALIMMGSNLGDRLGYLQKGIRAIISKGGKLIQSSPVYETAPWGENSGNAYLNQALVIETQLSPIELLSRLLEIEKEFGRQRQGENSPRTLDLDILLFGNQIIKTKDLIIPHPRFHLRKFNIMPVAKMLPFTTHPVLMKTMQQLLDECPDSLNVKELSK